MLNIYYLRIFINKDIPEPTHELISMKPFIAIKINKLKMK